MSNHDDIAALRLRFLEAWGDLTPVIIPGADDEGEEPTTAHCVLTIMPNTEDRLTIGPAPEYEAKGLIWCDVYSPIEDRDEAAWNLADRVASIYRDWQSEDARIRCDKISFRNGADEGKFMRIIINVSYRAQH